MPPPCQTCGGPRDSHYRCTACNYRKQHGMSPDERQALAQAAIDRVVQARWDEHSQQQPKPRGRYVDADALPPCRRCGRLEWEITKHDGRWEATCLPCGNVLYESPPLPYAVERVPKQIATGQPVRKKRPALED